MVIFENFSRNSEKNVKKITENYFKMPEEFKELTILNDFPINFRITRRKSGNVKKKVLRGGTVKAP